MQPSTSAMVCVIILSLYVITPFIRAQIPSNITVYHRAAETAYRLSSKPHHLYIPGRDVCMVEDIPAFNLTFPAPWTHGTFCSQPTYLRRQCCDGYAVAASEFGCPVVLKVFDVMTSAKRIPATKKFMRLMKLHHLDGRYRNRLLDKPSKAMTLLVPLDKIPFEFPPSVLILTKGFREMDNLTISELQRVVRVRHGFSSPLLLYHMLNRRWYTHQLYQNQLVTTFYRDMTVTVTKLSTKMVLFNCVPVHKVDIHARDGVLYVLQRPLPPAYARSLVDIISADPNLTMFFTILGYADLISWMRTVSMITVLAPTNDAFHKLPLRFIDSITYDAKYFPALQALSRNHLLEDLECSLGLRTKVKVKTMAGLEVPVSCSSSLELDLGIATVTRTDDMASNGVIHYLDKVLIPPKAMSLVQISRRAGASRFMELVKEVGLFEELVSFGPYTIFAPSNEALEGLNSSTLHNAEALRDLVLYHMVEGSHASFTLIDNQILTTLLPDTFVRVKIHDRTMSVEDGLVLNQDNEAFNGYVHILDRVIRPPKLSIANVLARSPYLRRFTSLVTQAGLALWRELSIGTGPFTIFAVRDEDVDRWAADLFTYYRILNDRKLLNRSMSIHLLDDFVMPRALEEGSHTLLHPRLRRRTPHRYPLRLTLSEGRLSLRHASVSKDYIICTNGIILFIDSLLLP